MGPNQTLLLHCMIRLGCPPGAPAPTIEEVKDILGDNHYDFVVKMASMDLKNLINTLTKHSEDAGERERAAGHLLGAVYACQPELLP